MAAGATTSNINASLDKGGHITGTVTAAGNAVADISVEVYRQNGSSWDWAGWAYTDSNGNYDVGGLGSGAYRVGFFDWNWFTSDNYLPTYYQNAADLDSATDVVVSAGATTANINVSLVEGGHIAGTVTASDGSRLPGISVEVYRQNGSTWYGAGWAQTGSSGEYDVSGLAGGTYRVGFFTSDGMYAQEYYNDASDLDSATDVSVTAGNTTSNIDAQLDDHAPPVAEVDPGNGSVTVDPQTGEVTVGQLRGFESDVTITKVVTCPNGATPGNVQLTMGTKSYAMTEDPVGSGKYSATIPKDDLQDNAELKVSKVCSGSTEEETVGKIELFDPSGYITDAATNQPVQGATVTLYKVPGWRAKTGMGDTANNTCQSNRSKYTGDPWSQTAPTNLGVMAATSLGEIDPATNPLTTDASGYYGWDVAAGCWYIIVQANGYETLTSPVVGVPPEVTDLHLALIPKQTQVYLPVILKQE